MFGKLGALFGRMGAVRQDGGESAGVSTAGEAIGLLLILTKAS